MKNEWPNVWMNGMNEKGMAIFLVEQEDSTKQASFKDRLNLITKVTYEYFIIHEPVKLMTKNCSDITASAWEHVNGSKCG